MAEPLLNHLFKVSISGDRYDQGFSFSAVSASQISEEITIAEGRSRARGASGVDRLRVEYPVGSEGMKGINTWFKSVCNSKRDLPKRTIDIELAREDGTRSGFIRLRNAWPCKVGLSKITKLEKSSAPLEFVEFVYEGIDRTPEERKAVFGDKAPPRPKGPPPVDHVLEGLATQAIAQLSEHAYRSYDNTPSGKLAWKEALKPAPKGAIPEIRQSYFNEVGNLRNVMNEQKNAGWKKCDYAEDSNLLRRQIGVKYKEVTPKAQQAEIYKRNWDDYGDPLGPTTKFMRSKGNSWNDIAEGATRTNKALNVKNGVKG